MARTKRSANLGTREARFKLPVGKMHQDVLAPGQYLAYRRPPKNQAGSWIARWNKDGKTIQARLGTADDYRDGADLLTHSQAQAEAAKWFIAQAEKVHLEATGEPLQTQPFTVSNAMDAYFQDRRARGHKGVYEDEKQSQAHIIPALGTVEVTKLTRVQIEKWRMAIAQSPKRKTGKTREEPEYLKDPKTEDELRARRNTANRIFAILKRALNLSAEDPSRRIDPRPWQSLKPFGKVEKSRVRWLDVKEQVRLVNACPSDFRRLVQGALYTGARYGELCRLQCLDFDPQAGTVYIAESKSGRPRYIRLTQEALDWFKTITAGRPTIEAVFLRDSVQRWKHKDTGCQWSHSDQTPYMHDACEAAGLESLTFHELRHTYATGLVNAGIPLVYVAEQLGHIGTRMVEKYYGHIDKKALAEAIRKLAPTLGISTPGQVEALKIQGA